MRMSGMVLCLVIFFVAAEMPAHGQWLNLSANLTEIDIHSVAIHPKNSLMIFAASAKRLYGSKDGGKSWRQLMGIRGEQGLISFIHIDPESDGTIYVGTSKGLRKSSDYGQRWGLFYCGIGSQSSQVYCMAIYKKDTPKIWLGTRGGLVVLEDSGSWSYVQSLPKAPVYSFLSSAAKGQPLMVLTQNGVFESFDQGQSWRQVYLQASKDSEAQDVPQNNQFDIEQTPLSASPPNLIRVDTLQRYYGLSGSGIITSQSNGSQWSKLSGVNANPFKTNQLTSDGRTFYAATEKGIFQWDAKTESFRDISEGLQSLTVHTVFYDPSQDSVYAGTSRGVYRYDHPQLNVQAAYNPEWANAQREDLVKYFANEPSIRQIQDAAIEYAEVHPRKIQQWRSAASRKALLPTVSFNGGSNTKDNVDIDRGGTADADKFIFGPKEKSYDWSTTVSWNLGELIWNDDQTAIDTRSKLMTELRNEVLQEVNHLHYERKRLQMQLQLSPPADLSAQFEQQFKLEELTASIDGLTGGYLSKCLSRTSPEDPRNKK